MYWYGRVQNALLIEATIQPKKTFLIASEPIAGVDSRAAMDGAEPKLKEENAKDVLNA
jgi:hypothetical protein